MNDKPKVGPGWDVYSFRGQYTSGNYNNITPSGINLGKSVKCVGVYFTASEINSSSSSVSQFTIAINGKGYSTETSWFDNRKGLNDNLFVASVPEYPMVLNTLVLNVTCPGSSVTIQDGSLYVIYN